MTKRKPRYVAVDFERIGKGLALFVHQTDAEAVALPQGSPDRKFKEGVAAGAQAALRFVADVYVDATKAAGVKGPKLN